MTGAVIVHPKLARAGFTKTIRPLLDKPEKFGKVGVRLVGFAFPHLDVELAWHTQGRAILLRVDGTDYPYRPVGGWWISSTGERLTSGLQQVPCGPGFHTQDLNGRPHPWFCFRGWREYHDHPGHQDMSWSALRRTGGYSVLALISQLHTDLNKTEVGLA